MGRRLVPLTLDNLQDLPKRCRACVFWELDPVSGEAAVKAGTPALEKEAWISAVLLDWAPAPGRLRRRRSGGLRALRSPRLRPPLHRVPHEPVSPDAVQLMTAFVMPGYQGRGWAG